MTGLEEAEYIGNTKFESCDIKLKGSPEEWRERARKEHQIVVATATVLKQSDAELEEWLRGGGSDWFDVAQAWIEHMLELRECYEAGIEALNVATARLLVVAERIDEHPGP